MSCKRALCERARPAGLAGPLATGNIPGAHWGKFSHDFNFAPKAKGFVSKWLRYFCNCKHVTIQFAWIDARQENEQNDGHGRFRDISAAAGVDHVGHSSGAVFFDYNNDGLLDLYVCNVGRYTNATVPHQSHLNAW